jgi:signal transduction histidine kinase
VITVRDHGIGVPTAEQPCLFRRLFNGSNAVALGRNGPGLGLAVTKLIIDAHGGRVALTSIPDRGTTATLILPDTPPAMRSRNRTTVAIAEARDGA